MVPAGGLVTRRVVRLDVTERAVLDKALVVER